MNTAQKIIGSLYCLLTALLFSTTAEAAYQNHASIHKAAKQFLISHVSGIYDQKPEIKMGKLDSRLKLKPCNVPLDAYLPKGSRTLGKITVGIKCAGKTPWSLHVPASVSLYIDVLVTTQPLTRNTVLKAGDLKKTRYDLAKLGNGYFSNKSQSVGMKLKRSLSAGTALTPSMVKKPQIIKRGQQVTILARSGRMEVRMTGKALANGAVGDLIQVINLSSKQKLEGIVAASGEVQINL